MLRTYLFSKDRQIVQLCRELSELQVDLTVYSRLRGDSGFRRKPSLVLVDDELFEKSVFDKSAGEVLSSFDDVPVVVISRESSQYIAIEYIKKGYSDFITYPCTPSFLSRRIGRLLDEKGDFPAEESVIEICEGGGEDKFIDGAIPAFASFIGESEVVVRMKRDLFRFAQSEFPVCLYGETGTGKNLLAAEIWKNSVRRNKPFLWENLGSLPSGLASGSLFGTRKGTFTGAENLPGLFETAQHGTVFLDEIECASREIQQALLCISDNMECKRVSSHKVIRPDVRIISASNADLMKLVEEGKFREDLYFRLTWLSIRIPALRERMEDLPLLVDSVLRKNGRFISAGAMDKLKSYSWPGNVRELFSCINRAAVLCSGSRVEASDISLGYGLRP